MEKPETAKRREEEDKTSRISKYEPERKKKDEKKLKKGKKLTKRERKKGSKTRTENMMKQFPNRFQNSAGKTKLGKKESGKKAKSKKIKKKEKDPTQIEGGELINWEKQKLRTSVDWRIFQPGQDPFFCILKPMISKSKEDLVVKYWNHHLKEIKMSEIEGYFKGRKHKFRASRGEGYIHGRKQKFKKRMITFTNLFYLTAGRVVIDEFYRREKNYAFFMLNVKSNQSQEFKIEQKNFVPHRFFLWESEKGLDSQRKVIVADFDRFSNLILMNFSSLF